MKEKKNQKTDRKKKLNPSIYRHSVNLTESEQADFLALFEKSGVYSQSAFIKARIFNKEFKVITIDKNTGDYYTRLTALFGQYRRVGVNYNQTVKELKTRFSEKKALALLYKLEKQTIELVGITRKIINLSEEFKSKWLPK